MPGSRWRSQRLWKPLTPYEAMEAVADLAASGESFAAYAKRKGYHRSAVAEAVKDENPTLYERLMTEHGGNEANASRRRGASFESSVKGALERRGYLVIKQYASKSAFDMLAIGRDRPNLLVQAKRDGKLPFSEWNALYALAEEHDVWPVLVQRPPGEERGFLWFRLTAAKEKKGLPQAPFLAPFDPREPEQETLLAPLVGSAG